MCHDPWYAWDFILIKGCKYEIHVQTSIHFVNKMDRYLPFNDQQIFCRNNIHHTESWADDSAMCEDIYPYYNTIHRRFH